MAKFFNTAGPCREGRHYMLPPEERFPDGLLSLIHRSEYFAVHAPRQVGKTTCFIHLTRSLNEGGRCIALLTSLEACVTATLNDERVVPAILGGIRESANFKLPESVQPPEPDPTVEPQLRLLDFLQRWSHEVPLPLVLFFDEIDSLAGVGLETFLRQLGLAHDHGPEGSPASIGLIGLRHVRSYRPPEDQGRHIGDGSSPFDIELHDLTVRYFTPEEVGKLYDQHEADTGRPFTPGAKCLAFDLTAGQPWLVNELARVAVDELVPDPIKPIEASHVDQAKEILIQRRDTHIDSLIARLREPRVRRVIEPILAGEQLPDDIPDDDVLFVRDLGLIDPAEGSLRISNPIYAEAIPRGLTSTMELSLVLRRPSYVDASGRLQFEQLLQDFRAFWVEQAESFLTKAPYSEAAAQLVFMAFLHKVVNGGGYVDREYAIGSGRVDLCLRWPREDGPPDRWALELKVWRDGRPDPLEQGLEQLGGYLERLGLEQGTLMIFDSRSGAAPLPERVAEERRERGGRRIDVLRL